MDHLEIEGGIPLNGQVTVSGAKNAALPIICATLLSNSAKPCILSNVPNLDDIHSACDLLADLGVNIKFNIKEDSFDHSLEIISLNVNNLVAAYELVKKMRASVLVLGPLLARFGQAKVSLPGGCAIGARPVDMHIAALEKMGAKIVIEDGYIVAHAPEGLSGAEIFFDKVSVGATENAVMAATLAKGKTIIHNAAREPEITDLCELLVKMGAKIEGIGTDVITIEGVKALHEAEHRLIPDRIEAGTFAIMAAATNGKLEIINCNPSHLTELIKCLRETGVIVEESPDRMIVYRGNAELKPIHIETAPYPLFPTDLQAQMVAFLSIINGTSHVTEKIFENRFMHVPELIRMGARIVIDGNTLAITGIEKFKAAQVMASDLRASVSLIIAGLSAAGISILSRIYHLDRGYERIEKKLKAANANIVRVRSKKVAIER